jgi:hypothetical protein
LESIEKYNIEYKKMKIPAIILEKQWSLIISNFYQMF